MYKIEGAFPATLCRIVIGRYFFGVMYNNQVFNLGVYQELTASQLLN